MVVDAFEFSDVAVLHHDRQKFDDDFGIGADENLSLASLLRIVDRLKKDTVGRHEEIPFSNELLSLLTIHFGQLVRLFSKYQIYST